MLSNKMTSWEHVIFKILRGKMESDSGESTVGIIDLSQLSKLSAGVRTSLTRAYTHSYSNDELGYLYFSPPLSLKPHQRYTAPRNNPPPAAARMLPRDWRARERPMAAASVRKRQV